eukprot:11643709-Ditylum_brightwellii.AAC.1
MIKDEYGDGICCQLGFGSYSIIYDGAEAGSGGAFGSSATHIMGRSCPSLSPSISPQPSKSMFPSFQPTISEQPTSTPTVPPTSTPTTSLYPTLPTEQKQEEERGVLMKLFTATGGEKWHSNTGWREETEYHCH